VSRFASSPVAALPDDIGRAALEASHLRSLPADVIARHADNQGDRQQVQRLLAAKHQRGRKVPNPLVAAAADARDLSVLHYDADFDRIAAVTGQACEWVVPGSAA
jgi:predicted nucleic acid-binding protein